MPVDVVRVIAVLVRVSSLIAISSAAVAGSKTSNVGDHILDSPFKYLAFAAVEFPDCRILI